MQKVSAISIPYGQNYSGSGTERTHRLAHRLEMWRRIVTAPRPSVTQRLETPEVHVLNFDQRPSVRVSLFPMSVLLLRMSHSIPFASLATTNGHPVNPNRRLNTIDKSFTTIEGQTTTISQTLAAINERSATGYWRWVIVRSYPNTLI